MYTLSSSLSPLPLPPHTPFHPPRISADVYRAGSGSESIISGQHHRVYRNERHCRRRHYHSCNFFFYIATEAILIVLHIYIYLYV